jgi:hypothetical protein
MAMTQAIIRPLEVSDTAAVAELHDRANLADPGLGPVPPEMWRRFIAQPANQNGRLFRVAERDGAPGGVAIVSHKQQQDRAVRLIRIVVV